MAVGNFESWKRTTLSQPVAPWDTTIYLASVPTVTSGRLYLKNQAQEEWIDFTGVSGSTVTGCSRGMSQTQDPSTSGTWLTWIAGTEVRLVVMHDQLANKQKTNTWTAAQTFSWDIIANDDIVTAKGVIATSYASTAARDAALWGDWAATQNYMNIKAGSAFYNYNLSTAQWEIVDTWTTPPDMTESVAGIGEWTTTTEAIGWVDNNGSNSMVTKPSDVHAVGNYFGWVSTTYNLMIKAERAAGAETIALKTKAGTDPSATDPIYIGFRNVTAWTWDWTYLAITSAESVIIPSTATMGASNSVPFRLWLVWFNDWGTFRLGIVNTQSGNDIMALDDDLLLSSTTIWTGSDSAHVVYSDSGVTSKAMRLIWYLDYTLATAGTRNTAPSTIQLFWPWVKKPWDIVQIATSYTGATATGSTQSVADDTIPQNTEWDQYLTKAIIPTSPVNRLLIDSQVLLSTDWAWATFVVALHQNSTANALSAWVFPFAAANRSTLGTINHIMAAGTTSSTTFKVRAGSTIAGTTRLNWQSWARLLGWVSNSYLKITELMA